MAAARIKSGMQDTLLLGNLDAKRDWGFAGDYVEAMWLMLQQEKPDDYVIATGKSYSVREFLEFVFNYADLDISKYLKIDERLFRPHEVPYLLGDSSKAQSQLNWHPKINFEELAIMMYESDLKSIKKEN
jgi:GDPmannose 4,6-dehydratase